MGALQIPDMMMIYTRSDNLYGSTGNNAVGKQDNNTHLTALFRDYPDEPVPKR